MASCVVWENLGPWVQPSVAIYVSPGFGVPAGPGGRGDILASLLPKPMTKRGYLPGPRGAPDRGNAGS